MGKRGSILIRLYSLLLFFSRWQDAESNLASIENNQGNIIDIQLPLGRDDWCQKQCQSLAACEKLYGYDHFDVRLKAQYSLLDGPAGQHLFRGKLFGGTVTSQTFQTQFIFDVSSALQISPCKVYVIDVSPEEQTTGEEDTLWWDVNNVFISFKIFNTTIDPLKTLTKQVQEADSEIYVGQVTNLVDAQFGVELPTWDFSLKLMYHIDIVGGEQVLEIDNTLTLNKGGLRWCEDLNDDAVHDFNQDIERYCEFESYFRTDVALALSIDVDNIDILFIKKSQGEDAIVISFRFIPLILDQKLNQQWVKQRENDLVAVVKNAESALYRGNVTFRTDPTWGVSGSTAVTLRSNSKRLNRSARPSPISAYQRCRDTHRCSRGWSHFNSSFQNVSSTTQRFAGGLHEQIPLFIDFEDWRQGTAGWRGTCNSKGGDCQRVDQKGAIWSPFHYTSSGPSIPFFNTSVNSGLVLNSARKVKDEEKQRTWIREIEGYLHWIKRVSNTTSLDANTRSRENIIASMNRTYRDYEHLLKKENDKISIMLRSQCANQHCHLLFNTSNLLMTGAINATGSIGYNSDGTEVALWIFDSIDIGAEVEVQLTGQRAIVLMSKTSINVNTSFVARAGTLGGFPGGYSTYRRTQHRLTHVCFHDNQGQSRKWECLGDHPISDSVSNTNSNNVNGPGSPSVRNYSFKVTTKAKIRREIQAVRTNANPGQRIEGGFILHFNDYSTSFIKHNINSLQLKAIMEDTLNPSKINGLNNIDRSNIRPGIGRVGISRFQNGPSGGYEWRVTFLSAIGDIGGVDSGQMSITNLLSGIGASAKIETIADGNTIGGSFALNFLEGETRYLQHDISAQAMEFALVHDVSGIINSTITRSGTNPRCNDGFCKDGPDQAGGYTWDISIVTDIGNVSPFSPTSSESDHVGLISQMVAKNNLTGCVESICPNITISMDSHTPFSLSYGGGGGSFGGEGGRGFGYIPVKSSYGDKFITNLLGGSGGALGFAHPYHTKMIGLPAKVRGGSGGGAIAFIARNDIVLGKQSIVSCNGENGWGSYMTAGGGGSGGSILLSAGGTVKITGKLKLRGGNGGIPTKKGALSRGGGGGGGRIAVYGESILMQSPDRTGGRCPKYGSYDCRGTEGTFFQDKSHLQRYSIDLTNGAMETSSSLRLHSFPIDRMLIGEEAPQISGPIYKMSSAAKPERVSFFVKVKCRDKVPTKNWGALFSLIPAPIDGDTTTSLGLSIGSSIKYGLVTTGGSFRVENRQHMSELHTRKRGMIDFERWHKIDIQLNWLDMVYSIHLDDYAVVDYAKFKMSSIETMSVSSRPSNVDIWIDELYVGSDTTLGFRCPNVTRGEAMVMPPVGTRDWPLSEMGGENAFHNITRHESHLSQRQDATNSKKFDDNELVDGKGHRKFTSGVKYSPHESNSKMMPRKVRPGDMLNIEDGNGFRRIWYGEHQLMTADRLGFTGGVGACSTDDMKTWKNEGILLHNMNVTDMVRGSEGPFHIEKPKVLYNMKTEKYVMWMIVDNVNRSLAMAGVATSDYATGPFSFVRSFYPDGNKTRDQTIHQEVDGTAYLIRSYYDTIEYVLPSPVMQPIWESVKNQDGSTNFPLTYHRAHYEKGYDNYHDIYLQRWRGEDKPWKVLCIDRLTETEREIPYGAPIEEQCTGPFEYKQVLGQGDPSYANTKDGIKSRFLDPNDRRNNAWKPSSVPGVKSQSWQANYESGTCGISLVNDDISRYDPNLDEHAAKDRSNCSHIADNPIHRTPPDQLRGKPQVVERRRAKFVAVSKLTFDYLDTTGALSTFEGELEGGADMSFLVNRAKESLPFQWTADKIGSTYSPPLHHKAFQTSKISGEVHQYESEYNDKSYYSLQCVIDKNCP